jgi:serine/threonine-protein kinase
MVSAAPDPTRPASLGDYQLVRRIAVGGMAEIFEARSLRADAPARRVVLKVLLPQYAGDAEFLRMLEDEAKVGMLLSHPNLVRMYEVGHAGARHFLVMDLVDGIALSDLIRALRQRDQRVPVEVLVFVIDQVLEALAYVHEVADAEGKPLQIVHRDVTPHNVLLSREGQVRLGDFGIARSNVRDARTRTGVIKGKLRYLAPEQVTGSAIDARTDLYAVGLMLFEMLTGKHFLEGETEIEMLRAAEAPAFRTPSSVADVDPRFDGVVRRALERFPEERYPNARAFLRALRKVGDELGVRGGPQQLTPWVSQVCDELPQEDVPVVLVGDESGPVGTNAVLEGMPRRSCPTVDVRSQRGRAGAEEPTVAAAVGGRDEPNLPETKASRFGYYVAAGGAVVLVAGGLWLRGWQTQGIESLAEAPQAGPPTASAPNGTANVVEQAIPQEEIEAGPPQQDGSPPAATSGRRGAPTKGSTAPGLVLSTTSAVATVAAVASAPDPEVVASPEQGLRSRLAAARSSLRARGILNDDLSAEARSLFSRAGSELAARRWEEASATVEAVEREVAAVRVDGPFVQRKMARVDQAMQAASRAGVDVSDLQPLSARALQAYMEGRYAETNRLLNELLAKLAAAKAR